MNMSNHKATETYYIDKCSEMLKNSPDYIRAYIRSIHHTTSPRTRYEYIKDIQNFLEYAADTYEINISDVKSLQSLTKTNFEEYFEYLEHYEKNGKEYTNGRTSIKRKLSALRNFFGYLFESELIRSDEIRKIKMPKLHKKEIIKMDKDEAAQFLTEVEHGHKLTKQEQAYHNKQALRDTTIVHLMLSTGIRVSECAELDINDVDIKNHALHIVRKGGNEATVYFSDKTEEILKDYLEYRKHLPKVPEDEQALFLSSRRERLAVRSIEVLIKKYAQRSLPLKHITPHKLRSTYATQLYKETRDIYLVAEALGHNDVTTTKNHYAEISEDHKKQNRNKVTF